MPESFGDGFPEKIAFAHLDMNHPAPMGALKAVLPRLSKGGVVVLPLAQSLSTDGLGVFPFTGYSFGYRAD